MNSGALLFDAAGRIRNTVSAPADYNAGLGSVQGLLSAGLAAPDHWCNGLPFSTLQNFLSAQAAAVNHYANGLPFTAAGDLAIDTGGAITHWHQGIPFTAAGRVAFAVPDAPVLMSGFSDGFSDGFGP